MIAGIIAIAAAGELTASHPIHRASAATAHTLRPVSVADHAAVAAALRGRGYDVSPGFADDSYSRRTAVRGLTRPRTRR